MIRAFDAIAQAGTTTPSLVASGISEALITTVAGLIVGIPSLVAYHYFRSKIDRYVYEMEDISLEILEGVSRERGTEEGSVALPVDVSSAGASRGVGEHAL
jgi:biopolymer transport protein ExbB